MVAAGGLTIEDTLIAADVQRLKAHGVGFHGEALAYLLGMDTPGAAWGIHSHNKSVGR